MCLRGTSVASTATAVVVARIVIVDLSFTRLQRNFLFISPDDIKEGMLQKFHIHETLNRPRANLCTLAADAASLFFFLASAQSGHTVSIIIIKRFLFCTLNYENVSARGLCLLNLSLQYCSAEMPPLPLTIRQPQRNLPSLLCAPQNNILSSLMHFLYSLEPHTDIHRITHGAHASSEDNKLHSKRIVAPLIWDR